MAQGRWPEGFRRVRCDGRTAKQFRRGRCPYWECTACGHQHSLRAGTLVEQSKLLLRTWLLAVYLLGQSKTNLSALELMRHLGVSYPAAWRLKHKLMQATLER